MKDNVEKICNYCFFQVDIFNERLFFCNNPKSDHHCHVLQFGHYVCDEFLEKTVVESDKVISPVKNEVVGMIMENLEGKQKEKFSL